MISFDHSTNPIRESHQNSSKNKNMKKRSMEDLITNSSSESSEHDQIINHNSSKPKTMKWAFDTDLHLQSPSPTNSHHSDQQCHFKLGKKYCYDQTHMNLDLELNLPCGTSLSVGKKGPRSSDENSKEGKAAAAVVEVAGEGDQKEMVAAACRRCHMLVMMCKASPACPNCKFLHPPEFTQPALFIKPRRTCLNSLLV